MSRRLLASLALALPLGAQAASWVRAEVADEHQHFYDRSNLSIEGDEISYWRRVIFRAPQATASGAARMAMYRERIDCRARTFRILGYLLYGQDGSVLENVYTPQAHPEPIAPATVGERFETLMCAFVEQARASQPATGAEPRPGEFEELQGEIQQLENRLRVLRERLRELGTQEAAPEDAQPPPAPGGQR
jgi:hypothetical protein